MPKINTKLASGSLRTGGSGGGRLSPSLLSTSAGGKISAGTTVRSPHINPNAGNVTYSPLAVPEIQQNVLATTLAGGATLADTVIQANMRFQDRQDAADADLAVLKFKDEMRKADLAYSQTELQQATQGHRQHTELIEQRFQEAAQNLSPAARQKAMLRLAETRNITLNSAAKHRVKQFNLIEQQNDYKKRQDTFAEIELRGFDTLATESFLSHLNNDFKTLEARQIAEGEYVTFAVTERLNQLNAASPNTPLANLQEVREQYDQIAPRLGELQEQELDTWFASTEAKMQKAQIAANEKANKKMRKAVEDEAPKTFAYQIKQNHPDNVALGILQIRGLYDTEKEAEKAVVDIMDNTFRLIVSESKSPTLSGKLEELDRHFGTLNPEHYTSAEFFQMTSNKATLENELAKMERSRVRTVNAVQADRLSKADDRNEIVEITSAPAWMSVEDAKAYEQAQIEHNKELRLGVPPHIRRSRALLGKHYTDMQEQGPLPDTVMNQLDEDYRKRRISGDLYNQIITNQNSLTAPGSKTEPFKNSPGYLSMVQLIKQAGRIGVFAGEEKPSGGSKKSRRELLEWTQKTEYAEAAAIADLSRAVRRAIINNQPFDYDQWWNTYVLTRHNNGWITGKTATQKVRAGVTVPFVAAEEFLDRSAKGLYHFGTGQGSVMIDPKYMEEEEVSIRDLIEGRVGD